MIASWLARAGLPWTIAWRYLRGRRSRLLHGTARSALAATGLGVAAMIVAMALMTGYREDLQRQLVGGNAAVVAYPLDLAADLELRPAALEALLALPGVERVSPVAYAQGTLASAAAPAGVEVTLRGVEAGEPQLGAARLPAAAGGEVAAIVLGEELAQRLGARPPEVLRLVVLGLAQGRPRFSFRSVRFAGTFHTGFSEFDRGWALLERRQVETLAGRGAAAGLYEFQLADPAAAPRLAARIGEILGPGFLVTDWQELNRELFTALRVQQWALFLVLGLIVVVSTFNVASTLMVLVRERLRDIGALAAIGLPPGDVRRIFLYCGGVLGLAGTFLGVALGWGIAWVLTTFRLIRFDPEVAAIYFISSVPFRVEPADVVAVVLFALAVNLAACVVPAWRAARVDPSAALRYE